MKQILRLLSLFATLAAFSSLSADQSNAFEEIMKKGFKSTEEKPALLKKVVDGKATKAEKAKLAEYLKKMVDLKPPEGNAASWKKKTQALVSAMEKNDLNALKNAANCKACHNVHK